ncbi:type II toxin-antitoxin system HicA family toxin [bacterium]|nr:type II toxin-antitoxin system HicA family toxin [bacterium]
MTRLPAVTDKQVINALVKDGWVIKSHRGSHTKLIKQGNRHPLIVPVHGKSTIPKGTLLNIIRDAGISKEEFIKLL